MWNLNAFARERSRLLVTATLAALLSSTSAGCLSYGVGPGERTRSGYLTATAIEGGAALALGTVLYVVSRSKSDEKTPPLTVVEAYVGSAALVALGDLLVAGVYLLSCGDNRC